MAQRRMFSPAIVKSDAFLDMPISTQALYFHLGMDADDDGFVNPKKVMRMTLTGDDDLRVLIGKRFVLPFENGVVVIKHWRVNNLVRKDWYHPTQYQEYAKTLFIKETGAYTQDSNKGLPFVNESSTEVSLGKVRLGNKKETYDFVDIDFDDPFSRKNKKHGIYQLFRGKNKKIYGRGPEGGRFIPLEEIIENEKNVHTPADKPKD